MRMLKQLVEFGHKLDEKMKTMLSEIKENVHGTSSDGKETRTQINGVDQKEERKKAFKKIRRGFRTSRTSVNIPTSESQGCQKEKRKSKKLKTYLNK